MNKKNKTRLSVLLVLAVVSALALCIAALHLHRNNPNTLLQTGEPTIPATAEASDSGGSGRTEPDSGKTEHLPNETNVPPINTDPPQEDSNYQPEDTYCVTFYGPDGRILFIDEVKSGEDAKPPENPIMPQGYVFTGWSGTFSNVTEDQSVYAECTVFLGEENVLALSGAYVNNGEETVIPLQLCGDVCLCAFDLRIRYDIESLNFVEFRNLDGSVDANCVPETGEIYLNYASMENTNGEVYLAELVFRAVGEPGKTVVDINIVDLVAYDSDYAFYEPPYSTIFSTVTIAAP